MAQPEAARCQSVSLAQLRESPFNPRKHYDEGWLNELAASIADRGILQPLLVRRIEDEKTPYEIVAGHRRSRAAKIAKLTTVPRDRSRVHRSRSPTGAAHRERAARRSLSA